MTAELPNAGFDAVVSNAALHHIYIEDTRTALSRLGGLVTPGGTLAVVTFVTPSLRNGLWHLTSWVACGMANRVKGKWEHSAPISGRPRRRCMSYAATFAPCCPGRVSVGCCTAGCSLRGAHPSNRENPMAAADMTKCALACEIGCPHPMIGGYGSQTTSDRQLRSASGQEPKPHPQPVGVDHLWSRGTRHLRRTTRHLLRGCAPAPGWAKYGAACAAAISRSVGRRGVVLPRMRR